MTRQRSVSAACHSGTAAAPQMACWTNLHRHTRGACTISVTLSLTSRRLSALEAPRTLDHTTSPLRPRARQTPPVTSCIAVQWNGLAYTLYACVVFFQQGAASCRTVSSFPSFPVGLVCRMTCHPGTLRVVVLGACTPTIKDPARGSRSDIKGSRHIQLQALQARF